jgi:hypothetical protein
MTALRCVICDHQGPDVRPSLIEWKRPDEDGMFGFVPRCQDRAACRVRCEAAGKEWPVPERRRPDA